jgi:hypothetical protein
VVRRDLSGTKVAAPMSMTPYPVDLVVTPPARYDRVQLALRFALAVALGILGVSTGWFTMVLYVGLPVIAAIVISGQGAAYYHDRAGPQVWRVVRWFLDLEAYVMLVADRFPIDENTTCRVELHAGATPTAGRALWRVVASIPAALVLCLFWIVSCLFTVIGWITILASESVPAWILRYQHAVLRAQARLFAYHASLVDTYPPLGLDDAGGASWPTARAQER